MTNMSMRPPIVFATILILPVAGCEMNRGTAHVAAAELDPPSESMEAALAEFRQDVPEMLTLADASDTRDDLVQRFASALENADSSAFAGMMMTRAEFAWLYYPNTKYTRPPYEMEAELLWFFVLENGEKGIRRALREYGGKRLGYEGYHCAVAPETEGRNTLWQGCVVRMRTAGGRIEKRLFGTILERDGLFKFVSFANDL